MNLKEIILEYQSFIKELDVKTRDYQIDPEANYVITGIRRAGKTWFLFQIIKQYFGNDYEKILYINFEDDRFIDFKVEDFDNLLNAYYELYPDNKPVLFLDEVQNINGWEKFCRRVADQKYRTYVTGSNAKMLSIDIASTLGARYMQLEICPLSFPEFLYFNGITIEENDIYTKKKNVFKNQFEKYFRFGGFPEILNIASKRDYLHNIFSTILFSDIIIKNNIRDFRGIKLLVKKLAESTNDELSFNRMKNLLKASGSNTGTPTVISWIESLESSFLIREIKNMNYKFSERESKKKYYFIDNGLLYALGENSDSKLLETLTFNTLARYYKDIMFFKTKNIEVDFVIPEKSLFQTSYTLNNDMTRDREIKSLLKASDFLGIDDLYIITYDTDEQISIKSKTIKIIPLWKLILTLKRQR